MNKKNPKDMSVKEKIGNNFTFSKIVTDYEKGFDRLVKNFKIIVDNSREISDLNNLQEMFRTDAIFINAEFQKEHITREEAKELYKILYDSINSIGFEIRKVHGQLQEFVNETKHMSETTIKKEGISFEEGREHIIKEVDKIRESLPRIEFGMFRINADSTLDRDRMDITEFFKDHLGGIIVIPEIKCELRTNLPTENYDIEEKIINKNIVFTFKQGAESEEV